MSNKFNNAAQEIGKFGSKGCRLVLWYLADHANDKGVVYVGYEKLMERCEIGSRATLDEVLGYLAELGILRKQKRWLQCNKYFLILDRMRELAGVDASKKWGGNARAQRAAARASKSVQSVESQQAATLLDAMQNDTHTTRGGHTGDTKEISGVDSTDTLGKPRLTEVDPGSPGSTLRRNQSTLRREMEVRSGGVGVRSVGDIPSVIPTVKNDPYAFPSAEQTHARTSLTSKTKIKTNPTPPQAQQIVAPRSTASGASTPQVPPSPYSRSGVCALCDAVIPGGVGRMCASCAEPPVRRAEKKKPAPAVVAHKCAECKLTTVRAAGALCVNCDEL
jgi:hypothetical protein